MVLDDLADGPGGTIEYPNVPGELGYVVSSGKASIAELDSVLSLEDLWDLIEILTVDAHNLRIIREAEKNKEA